MSTLQFESFTVNGVLNPANPLDLTMNKDIIVTANYIQIMGIVTINGSVSAQSAAGETVMIVITKPDSTKVTITAVTLADKTFSKPYTDVAGSYSLVASIGSDADFNEATSPTVPFTIAKQDRTITVSVS